MGLWEGNRLGPSRGEGESLSTAVVGITVPSTSSMFWHSVASSLQSIFVPIRVPSSGVRRRVGTSSCGDLDSAEERQSKPRSKSMGRGLPPYCNNARSPERFRTSQSHFSCSNNRSLELSGIGGAASGMASFEVSKASLPSKWSSRLRRRPPLKSSVGNEATREGEAATIASRHCASEGGGTSKDALWKSRRQRGGDAVRAGDCQVRLAIEEFGVGCGVGVTGAVAIDLVSK
mmetsp:Transcript_155/g.348  ORF Transcript_155/g.348 Transcript_155/m.348 type:complete len:232 (+) Transcript_155:979-1674(+)